MMRQCHLAPVQEEDRSQAGQGGKNYSPGPGLDHAGGSVSTQRTSTSPPSRRPA